MMADAEDPPPADPAAQSAEQPEESPDQPEEQPQDNPENPQPEETPQINPEPPENSEDAEKHPDVNPDEAPFEKEEPGASPEQPEDPTEPPYDANERGKTVDEDGAANDDDTKPASAKSSVKPGSGSRPQTGSKTGSRPETGSKARDVDRVNEGEKSRAQSSESKRQPDEVSEPGAEPGGSQKGDEEGVVKAPSVEWSRESTPHVVNISEKEGEYKLAIFQNQQKLESNLSATHGKLGEIAGQLGSLTDLESTARLKIQDRFLELHRLLHSMEQDVLIQFEQMVNNCHQELLLKQKAVKQEQDYLIKCQQTLKECSKIDRIGLINTFPQAQALIDGASLAETKRPLTLSQPMLDEQQLDESQFLADCERHVIRAVHGGGGGRPEMVRLNKIVSQFSAKSLQDAGECVLYDICYIGEGKLIAVDNRNKSLKLLENGSVVSEVLQDNPVCRISRYPNDRVIVCDSRYLLYLYRTDLHFESSLQLPPLIKKPYGLALKGTPESEETSLLVGDRQDGQIYELTLDDSKTIIRQFSSGFSCLDYIHCTSDKVIVSHGNGSAVTVLTGSGQTLFELNNSSHSPLNWPLGVAIDALGNSVVCDSCNHRVAVFDEDGRLVKELKSLYLPRAVQFTESGEIVIAERGGSIKTLTYLNHN